MKECRNAVLLFTTEDIMCPDFFRYFVVFRCHIFLSNIINQLLRFQALCSKMCCFFPPNFDRKQT